MSKIRDFYFFRDFWFWALGDVEYAWFTFDESPLKALFTSVHVNTLAILTGYVIKKAPYVSGKVAILDLDVTAFNRKFITTFLCDIISNRTASKTANVLSQSIHHSKARANNMSRVVHGNHLFPVARPSIHILWVTRGKVLKFA